MITTYILKANFNSIFNLVSTRSSLRKALGEKVVSVHDGKNHFIIQTDEFNEKRFSVELQPKRFEDVKQIAIKLFNWINLNGSTDKDCGVTLEVFNKGIKSINKFKQILNFDEDYIFSLMPSRKNHYDCESIKTLMPKDFNVLLSYKFPENFTIPNDFYYGVNYLESLSNKLTYNYFGGTRYQLKKQEFIDYLTYINSNLEFNILNNNKLNDEEITEFYKVVEKTKLYVNRFSSIEKLINSFKKINFTVNLLNDELALKTHWTYLRPRLFKLLLHNRLYNSFTINLDTDTGLLEVVNCSNVFGSYLIDLTLVNCVVKGNISDSIISDCELKDSSVSTSQIINTNITNCGLINCSTKNVEITKSYINNNSNNNLIVGGHINSGSIINATYKGLSYGEEYINVGSIKKFPFKENKILLKNLRHIDD